MMEITVVLVIVLGMAALVTPALMGRIDHARVEAAAESLESIRTAIHDPRRGGGSFRQHVGVFPSKVSHLTRQITLSDRNSCGTAYTSAETSGWRGPYLNRTVPATGLPIGIGIVRDTLPRDPSTGGTAPVIRVRVDSVIIEDAAALDLLVDGVRDSTAGSVRWGALDADRFVVLDYLLPLKNC